VIDPAVARSPVRRGIRCRGRGQLPGLRVRYGGTAFDDLARPSLRRLGRRGIERCSKREPQPRYLRSQFTEGGENQRERRGLGLLRTFGERGWHRGSARAGLPMPWVSPRGHRHVGTRKRMSSGSPLTVRTRTQRDKLRLRAFAWSSASTRPSCLRGSDSHDDGMIPEWAQTFQALGGAPLRSVRAYPRHAGRRNESWDALPTAGRMQRKHEGRLTACHAATPCFSVPIGASWPRSGPPDLFGRACRFVLVL